MIDNIMSLTIFQDRNKRCSHPLNPRLIQKAIVYLLTSLHEGYIHDCVGAGFNFSLGAGSFFVKYREMTFRKKSHQVHYEIAFIIVEGVYKDHYDVMIAHFSTHEVGEGYCELMDKTVFKGMAENKRMLENTDVVFEDEEIMFKSYPESIYEADDVNISSGPFDCSLNPYQINKIADFCNLHNIFTRQITNQDLNDFFCCKEGFFLQANTNVNVINLMWSLSENAFINHKWESVIENNKLLLSSTGNGVISHSSMSTESSRLRSSQKRKPKDEAIINFVASLKQLNKH